METIGNPLGVEGFSFRGLGPPKKQKQTKINRMEDAIRAMKNPGKLTLQGEKSREAQSPLIGDPKST